MAARFPAWPVSRRFNTLDSPAYARAPMVTPHSNEAYLQHATLSLNCPSNESNQPLSPHGSQKVVTPSDTNTCCARGINTLLRFPISVVGVLVCKEVAEATSNTRRMCAIPRSLAWGHDKSCGPQHGTKISLILKGVSDPRIRD